MGKPRPARRRSLRSLPRARGGAPSQPESCIKPVQEEPVRSHLIEFYTSDGGRADHDLRQGCKPIPRLSERQAKSEPGITEGRLSGRCSAPARGFVVFGVADVRAPGSPGALLAGF